jgi:hypothetical protein
MGCPETYLSLISRCYEGHTTTIKCADGDSRPIRVMRGVLQGDPMSPFLFNVGLEVVLQDVANLATDLGYGDTEASLPILTYADDMEATCKSPEAAQELVNAMEAAASPRGFRFNAPKCASLSIKAGQVEPERKISIAGTDMPSLGEEGSYQYLGTAVGFRMGPDPVDTLERLRQDIGKLDKSLLTPWQKINALKTFLLPRLNFLMRAQLISYGALDRLEKGIRTTVKSWLNLPKQATCDILYMDVPSGGIGLVPIRHLYDMMKVVHAFRLLSCKDPRVRQLAWKELHHFLPNIAQDATAVRGLNPGPHDKPRKAKNTWAAAKVATSRLRKLISINWNFCEARNEVELFISSPTQAVIIPDNAQDQLQARLRQVIQSQFKSNLLNKPDQGKAFHEVTRNPVSNHMISNGDFTRFCDWKFLFKARLNLHPLNGAVKGRNNDKRCRRCNEPNETLPHVLQHCPPTEDARFKRHDAVAARIGKAMRPPPNARVFTNQRIPGWSSARRPDICILDDEEKEAIIVDILVTFENGRNAFEIARTRKDRQYEDLENWLLENQDFTKVTRASIIVGSLGTWDPDNERVLRLLNVNPRYTTLMRKLIVSDTIKWSRDIYIEHVCGYRQY